MDIELKQNKALNKQNIEQIQKQKQEFKLIGKQRYIPGLTLFSYNTKTKKIKKAEINKVAKLTKVGVVYERKIQIEKGCIYGQALNEKNFIKHINKM